MNEPTLIEAQGTAQLGEHSGEAGGGAPAAGWGDVADFNAAVNQGNMHTATPAFAVSSHTDVQSLLSGLQSVSSTLQARGKALDKALIKSTQALDPEAMWKVSREMSEMYLETSLAVKVIGKVEQAVDQLTRLQ